MHIAEKFNSRDAAVKRRRISETESTAVELPNRTLTYRDALNKSPPRCTQKRPRHISSPTSSRVDISRSSTEMTSREPIARRTRLSKTNMVPRAGARAALTQTQNILLSNRFDALVIQTSESPEQEQPNDSTLVNSRGVQRATRKTTSRRITRSMSQQLSNMTGPSAPMPSSGASAPRSSRMANTVTAKRRATSDHVQPSQRRSRLRRATSQNQEAIIDDTLSNNTETLLNSRGENSRMERRSSASVGHSEVPGMGAPGPPASHPRF